MSTLQKKRFDYIDATKGVAILCITFLHFEQGVIPGWLNAWIGLFMITTFYFTSGWVSGMSNKPITAKELFNKRIRQLGVPYLWFSLLIILFDVLWVVLGFMKSDILLRDIYKTIVLRGIGTLWFLPVLFIGEYIFTVMRNSKRVWLWAIVGLAITLFVDYAYKCVELNKLLDATIKPFVRGLYAWPIIALGFLMGRMWGYKILSVAKTKLFIISSFIFAFSLLLVINPPVTIYYINRVSSNILPAIAFMCLFAALSKNIIIIQIKLPSNT